MTGPPFLAVKRGGVPQAAPRVPAPLAWPPVLAVLAVDAALLAATATRYGYHRDELYFRLLAGHPAWGYVDQAPFTPMLAKVGIAIFGDNLWALRAPAMMFALAAVLMMALLARELGGGRAAQLLTAVGGSGVFVLIAGHVLLTATPDLLLWLLTLFFVTRAFQRDDTRWWVAAGALVGVATYNKQLIAVFVISLAVGVLVAGPRRHLASRHLWYGVGLAALLAVPNVVYQVAHGWPEATMAHALAAHKGHDDRVFFLPFQVVLLGVTATPITVAGLIRLLRHDRYTRVRAVGVAYLAACAVVLVTGGQPYYTFGLLAFVFTAGCVVTAEWATGAVSRWRWVSVAVGLSAATAVVFAIPVFPVRDLPAAVAYVNQAARDSVGWPAYVREIAAAYRTVPASQRAYTIIVTDNYGEAGAVARYGSRYGLPRAYSGQNQLFAYGPPPSSAATAIVVGLDHPTRQFTSCAVVDRLDDGVGVTNEEQDRPVDVCRGPRAPWPALWRTFRHYD